MYACISSKNVSLCRWALYPLLNGFVIGLIIGLIIRKLTWISVRRLNALSKDRIAYLTALGGRCVKCGCSDLRKHLF